MTYARPGNNHKSIRKIVLQQLSNFAFASFLKEKRLKKLMKHANMELEDYKPGTECIHTAVH